MMIGFTFFRKPYMATCLTRDEISEEAEKAGQFAAANVTRNFHNVRTSSRT